MPTKAERDKMREWDKDHPAHRLVLEMLDQLDKYETALEEIAQHDNWDEYEHWEPDDMIENMTSAARAALRGGSE